MRPAVAPLADEVLDELDAVGRADGDATNWALLKLLDACLSPAQAADDIARDDTQGRPGHTALLDPDRCPPWALRWLGQMRGVRIAPGNVTDPVWIARARAQIKTAAGLRRGTVGSTVAATQATLTGVRNVRLIERDSSAYHYTVAVRTSECPDPAATEKAARVDKNGGLQMTFVLADGPLIDEGTRTIDALAGTIDGATVANWT